MNKIISVLILAAAIYGGYRLYLFWEQVKAGEDLAKSEAAASDVKPENLPGMPGKLAPSYEAALKQGPAVTGRWLATYGKMVHDPRRAWIELDYCAAIAREDPTEARRVFATVKERTPPSSPVWSRVHQLEKSYE